MKMRKMSTVGKQKLAPTGSRWLEDEEYVVYLEDISKPYWRRDTKLQYVGQWPVGGPAANPAIGGEKGIGGIEYFRGLRDDFKRKSQFYASDWLDGFRGGGKSLAAVCFLYFACLAPVVAFGGAMGSLTQVGPASPTSHPSPISPYLPPTSHVPPPTSHLPRPTSHLPPPTSPLPQGAMGIAEVIASCGICGMLYAVISGQPMTFVAPTGLTLAFTAALYKWCIYFTIPFLPMYAWVGCWTSLMMIAASVINASGLIRYCTRFTGDLTTSPQIPHISPHLPTPPLRRPRP